MPVTLEFRGTCRVPVICLYRCPLIVTTIMKADKRAALKKKTFFLPMSVLLQTGCTTFLSRFSTISATAHNRSLSIHYNIGYSTQPFSLDSLQYRLQHTTFLSQFITISTTAHNLTLSIHYNIGNNSQPSSLNSLQYRLQLSCLRFQS